MDFNAIEIGGISLIALVFGLVEFIKSVFGLQGRIVTVISALTGAALMLIYQAMPMLPPDVQPWVTALVTSLAFGLAASGFYKFVKSVSDH